MFSNPDAETETAKEYRLPNPQISLPLTQIMNVRATMRHYNGKMFNDQIVSDILWAAFGKNKKGTRTIPTALNEKNLKIFVLEKDGVWQYDSENNRLILITREDVIPFVAQQEYVEKGALNLLYTGSDKEYSPLHAGSAYQNVYLYAQDRGLATVVRAFINKEKLKKALNLSEEEFVIIHQVVGYPAEKD